SRPAAAPRPPALPPASRSLPTRRSSDLYGLPVAALRDWHRPRIEVLASAGPDLLALETVPDVDEAEALVEAVAGIGVPAWLSYSVAGERTRAGQPLADAFAVAADAPGIVAVGVNCCAPADVPAAVALAREV